MVKNHFHLLKHHIPFTLGKIIHFVYKVPIKYLLPDWRSFITGVFSGIFNHVTEILYQGIFLPKQTHYCLEYLSGRRKIKSYLTE